MASQIKYRGRQCPSTCVCKGSQEEGTRREEVQVYIRNLPPEKKEDRKQNGTRTHLNSTPTRHQRRVKHHIPRHTHRIRKVAVDLIQDILRRAAQEDRAGFRRVALDEECEVPRMSHRMHVSDWIENAG